MDERHRGSWLLTFSAIAGGVAFVALALLVRGGPLPVDLALNDGLRPLHAGVVGAVVDLLDFIGQPLVWDLVVVLGGVGLWRRGHHFAAVVLIVGVVGADACATVAKLVIGRPRPPGIVVADVITQASYPSGHVTRTVATMGLLAAGAWGRASLRAPAVLAAVAVIAAMGFSRIITGEHWFTDVIGAVLFGLVALCCVGLAGAAAGRGVDARPPAPPFTPPRRQ
jgi:membrane-associated phospholipid phosphatase